MPIIIEGPDGAGKSTLAAKLAKRLDLNILKMTANGGQSAGEYIQKLGCDGIVIDRCWISEQIYADIFGREQRLDDENCEMLTDFCFMAGIPIVVVLPPLYEVVKRLTKRGDEFGDVVIENIEEIYHRYEAWVDEHPQCVLVTDNGITECIEGVLKCML